jgi:hypothetical protein
MENTRNDFTLIKHQIASEVLKENDDVDERYYRYQNPESLTFTIGDGITNASLSEDQLRERIKRCLEVEHNGIIGAQHFSEASYECIQAYRLGLFRACVMMTHPINEGIIKFVAERNRLEKIGKLPDTLGRLVSLKLITGDCAQASEAIWESFRNDIHHMNPGISKIKDWHRLAKQNLRHLATVEYCVFGHDINQGALRLHYPQYWDLNDEEHVKVYVRFVILN